MFLANKLNKGGSLSSPDAQFNYVTMLLHGDGTNGAQNNTFLDSSTNNFTITRNGNTTQGSFSPYGSNWSSYFNSATPDYFTFANSSNFAFGTGNFTIEFWFNASSALNDKMILDFRNGGSSNNLVISTGGYTGSAGSLRYASGSIDITSGSTLICNGLWNHCAVVRSGTTVTLYVNGVSTATGTDSSNFSATSGTNYFGRNSYGSGTEISGYFSNCRIVKGTAVYTSGFTPSTTPLTAVSGTSLLTFQSNRFVDNSGNSVTLTASGTPSVQRFNPFGTSTAYSTSVIGGSGYFSDSSGTQMLYLPSNTAFNLDANFTIEGWVYKFNTTSKIFLGSDYNSGSAPSINNQIQFDRGTAGTTGMYHPTTGWLTVTCSSSPNNAWFHLAYVRSGSTVTIYLNGVSQGTISTSETYQFSGGAVGGLRNYSEGSGGGWYGYMSNFRIVKGTAVYTGNFTPPTTPLTAITNTSLLLSMTNGAIFDNAMMNDLETVGNAQISTSVKKYGTGSLAFDGSGDYLAGPYSPNLDFGTGDFTVELWFYFNGSVTGAGFIGSKNTGGMDFAFTSSSLRIGRINTAWDSTFSWSPSANTWYHIAFTRSNGTARAFVNGTQVGSSLSNTNNYYPNGGVYVGVSSPPDRYINGYIDDLRITKGYARYTATFTPPTKALSDTGP